MTSFRAIPDSDPIHQVVTPLITSRGGAEHFASGTAFVIGPGWALTAYHVLHDFVARYQAPPAASGNIDITFQMYGYLALGADSVIPITFLRAWRAAPTDIAVLRFGVPASLSDEHRWVVPAVDLLPPRVGTPIAAVGFPATQMQRASDVAHARLVVQPTTSTGKVVEIHHQFRDSSQLPFPCFQTDARFDGGMSGGPVFDTNAGHICGMVCSSLQFGDPGDGHVSYASSLWPALATVVDSTDDGVSGAPPYPLARLFEREILQAKNADRIAVSLNRHSTYSAQANYDSSHSD